MVQGDSAQVTGREDALSVSAAMALAKSSLETLVVRIVGEVSEVSVKPGYKAAYFTVKDASASLPCMMWNNRYNASGVRLQVGQLVELSGRFTLYAAKGRMNFDVFSLSLAGEGVLRMKVAEIAKLLSAEGLTDPSRKRELPVFPERIGLVTSPRSAAVHDVLRTLRRRYPIAEVLLAGVPVEGASAPAALSEGLKAVCEAGAEVVLIVRGGGSFEDLMPFNDEALARQIAACPVPVVTGIGHEVDTSIADMVSDLRASTPTGAAEAVSPSRESLESALDARKNMLERNAHHRLDRIAAYLERVAASSSIRDPRLLFAADARALDALSERIARALPAKLERDASSLDVLRGRLSRIGSAHAERYRYRVAAAASRLEDLSPVAVLARGYSIARNERGAYVRRIEEAPEGSRLELTVTDGRLTCEVVASEAAAPFRFIEEE